GFLKSRLPHRLEEIVDGIRLKRAHCVAIVGCNKNNTRHAFEADSTKHSKTISLWHLNIEEHQVGFLFENCGNSALSVRAFANDLSFRVFLKESKDSPPRQRLIINDQHSNLHAVTMSTDAFWSERSRRTGMETCALTP